VRACQALAMMKTSSSPSTNSPLLSTITKRSPSPSKAIPKSALFSNELVDGDELVFIIAKAWQAQNRLKNNTVVGTQMTNLGVRHGYKDLGIDFIETDVGDRFVMQQMQKSKAVLGGEGSGHIICLEQTTSGDGIIAALQVLEVLVKTGKTLNVLKSEVQKYPQVLINVKTKEKIANYRIIFKSILRLPGLGNDENQLITIN
jgi:phosphoglucosamine mutase